VTEKAVPEAKAGWSRMVGRASTTVDSIKEFMEMTPYGKGVMTLSKRSSTCSRDDDGAIGAPPVVAGSWSRQGARACGQRLGYEMRSERSW